MKFTERTSAGLALGSTIKFLMSIDFQPLSMMELRSRPGEVLDEVAKHGRAFIIERTGQQKACLVPISFFLPDIQPSRIAKEFDSLSEKEEEFSISITPKRKIKFLFSETVKGEPKPIKLCIILPHGYPHKPPIVKEESKEESITQGAPHRWKDGSLCIYGAMDTWNPGKHDIAHTLNLCRRWFTNYAEWRDTGEWPK